MHFLGHAGGIDLFFELVDFVFFAAAEFLLNGFELFVEVILFLRALHLALHAGVDVAVDVELFELDFKDVADAVEALERDRRFRANPVFRRPASCRLAAMVSDSRAGSSTRAAAIMVS